MSISQPAVTPKTDVVLVGAGIMSATLAALLRLLEPGWSITLVERLDAAAGESSDPWHNAGTGHSALCELNYTPQRNGSIDISKAVRVNEQFQVTRQFWAYAAENDVLTDVRGFLNTVPHASFVQGADGVDYLRRRQQALATNPLFARTQLILDPQEFARRLPLMTAGRDFSEPIGLNWAPDGTDVDFGALAKQLIAFSVRSGTTALFNHEVRNLSRQSDGSWTLSAHDRRTGEKRNINARFVFVGAGGNALPLLQRSGIPEIKGFAGFPIGGRFLRADSPELTAAHRAKVYGAPAPGAPPLGALHLDLRFVGGKPWLVFGPYAGWSPKFLKYGRLSDLPRSVRADNALSIDRCRRQPTVPAQLSARPTTAFRVGPRQCAASVRPHGRGFGLAPYRRRSAGPGDPARPTQRRVARVRHHGRQRGRRQHRGVAGCLAGGVHRRTGDAGGAATLLHRPLSILATDAERNGALAGSAVEPRAGLVRGSVVLGLRSLEVGGQLMTRAGDDQQGSAIRKGQEERRR